MYKGGLMNRIYDFLFIRNNVGKSSEVSFQKNNNGLPLAELAKHVGEPIEVRYINQDIPKIASIVDGTKLVSLPNENSFYISKGGQGYFIVHWYAKDTRGKLDAIKSIKLSDGQIIFENSNLDYHPHLADAEAKKAKEKTGTILERPIVSTIDSVVATD
jgi:hypothetical protein